MKKIIQKLLLGMALMVASQHAGYANLFRLGFPGANIAGIDFPYNDYASLEAAANSGDTVQVYQHYFPAGQQNIYINKPLRFMGYGYQLHSNAGLQVVNIADSVYDAPLGLYFQNGSDGATVDGLLIQRITIYDVNNISIRKCKIHDDIDLANGVTINNLTIRDCFTSTYFGSNFGFNIMSINLMPVTNLRIVNNYMGAIYLPGGTTGTIANNVFAQNSYGFSYVHCNVNGGINSNVLIKNNIVTLASYAGCYFEPTGNIGLIKNNVFAYPSANCTAVTGNGNFYNVNMATTFTAWNGGNIFSDAQLTIATGSVALTAGRTNSNGLTQAGLFGGESTELYKLSGIPSIPSFYMNTLPFIVSNSVTNYSGNVSTRSNSTSNITRIEFYIDMDPGYGLATSAGTFTLSPQIVNKSVTVAISALAPGMHTLVIRSKDAAGNWSLNNIRYFFKQYPSPVSATLSTISQMEYFIDTDPGIGLATDYPITAATDINTMMAFDPTPVASGIHRVCFRAKTANGHWSLTNSISFFKPYTINATPTTLPNLSKVEYYIDTDPGFGNAISIPFTAANNLSNVVIPFDPATISEGIHTFAVRAMDAAGQWSLINKIPFFKPYTINATPTTLPNLSKVEYYIDTDPGYGNAISIPFTVTNNLSNVIIPFDPATVSEGIHTFAVRAMDAAGHWSLINKIPFFKPYNLSSTPTTWPNLTRVEYYIDNDPGYGNAVNIPITATTDLNNLVVPVDLSNMLNGSHRAVFRAMDANGKWSLLNDWIFTGGEVNGIFKPGSGEAIAFNGYNHQIELGNSFTEQNFTIEMWVKPAAYQVANADIFDNNHSTNQGFVCQNNPANNNEYFFSACNASGASSVPFTLVPEVWQHLSCVKSATQLQVFINGILVGTTSWSGNIDYNSPQLILGNWANGGRNWNGQMDEVRIYHTPLTQTQIREGMCRKIKSTDPLFANLTAYFNFDEGAGSIAHNLVDGISNAALVNVPTWIKSGAAIGDISTYSYGGINPNTWLSIPGRNDSLQAYVLSGTPDGLHEYAVLETPNTVNGIQGIGSNDKYFGTFVVNGNNPTLQINHWFDGIAGAEVCNMNFLQMYRRLNNAEMYWNGVSANISSSIGNHFVQYDNATPGEYMLGSTGAPLFPDSAQVYCKDTLDLKFFLQGYYLASEEMTPVLLNQGISVDPLICDSVWIDVWDVNSELIESQPALLDIYGNCRAFFYNPIRNNDYFVGVRHRNTIQTASANLVNFQTLCNYDFTTDAMLALGDNQMEIEPGIYAFYQGDMNQDGSIDALDYLLLDPDIQNGESGYFNTDLNGDGSVDALDYLLLDPNIQNGISSLTP